MKRLSLGSVAVIAALALFASPAEAQTPLHLIAGPTFGTISTDDFDGAGTSVGFFAGIGTSVMLTETVALSPYLVYAQKGTEFDDGEKDSYDYIELPLLLGVQVPVGESVGLNLFAGPQIGLQINCDEDGFDCSDFSNHKSTEFGVVGGASVAFPTGGGAVSVGGGVDIGLTDLFDELDYKTRTFFLSLQYTTYVGG